MHLAKASKAILIEIELSQQSGKDFHLKPFCFRNFTIKEETGRGRAT